MHLRVKAFFGEMPQMLSLNLFEKTPLDIALRAFRRLQNQIKTASS